MLFATRTSAHSNLSTQPTSHMYRPWQLADSQLCVLQSLVCVLSPEHRSLKHALDLVCVPLPHAVEHLPQADHLDQIATQHRGRKGIVTSPRYHSGPAMPHIPGHACLLQSLYCVDTPEHVFPFRQRLVLDWRPPPHDAEQPPHLPHWDHLGGTGGREQ